MCGQWLEASNLPGLPFFPPFSGEGAFPKRHVEEMMARANIRKASTVQKSPHRMQIGT